MPDEIGKSGDPDALFDQLVIEHVRELEPREREELFASLPAWLERGHPSGPFLVPLLGCVFGRPELVDGAIEAAQRSRSGWPFLQLQLIYLSRKFPSERLTAFVRALAADLGRASTDEERNLATRAGITLCFLGDPIEDRTCLEQVLAAARTNEGRHISEGLVLIRLLFLRTGRLQETDSLFTVGERQRARELLGDYESAT
jgi:hypothetical protein